MSENYVGFWRRLVALMVDNIIFVFLLTGIGFFFKPLIFSVMSGFGADYNMIMEKTMIPLIGLGVAHWAYHVFLESASRGATPGKMAIGAVVIDLDGDRLSFLKANIRYFGKILSAIILMAGFIMAGFTQKKQALHDLMAGSLVVTIPISKNDIVYVGFWRRVVAYFVDYIVIIPTGLFLMSLIGLYLLSLINGFVLSPSGIGTNPLILSLLTSNSFLFTFVPILFYWFYFTIFESSPIQATPGKMAIDAVVTDLNEKRISFGQANVRFWGKMWPIVFGAGLHFFPSSIAIVVGAVVYLGGGLIVAIGFLMVGFTEMKQGLHDIIAGCLVVNKRPSEEEEIIIDKKSLKALDQKKDSRKNEQQKIKGLSLGDRVIIMAKDFFNNNNCIDFYSKKVPLTKGKFGEWKSKEIDDFTYLVDFRTDKEWYSFEVDFNTGIVSDVWSVPYLREKYENHKNEHN